MVKMKCLQRSGHYAQLQANCTSHRVYFLTDTFYGTKMGLPKNLDPWHIYLGNQILFASTNVQICSSMRHIYLLGH